MDTVYLSGYNISKLWHCVQDRTGAERITFNGEGAVLKSCNFTAFCSVVGLLTSKRSGKAWFGWY